MSAELNIALSGIRSRYHSRKFVGFFGGFHDSSGNEVSDCITQCVSEIGENIVGVCGGSWNGFPGVVIDACINRSVPVVGVLPARAKELLHPHVTHPIIINPRIQSSEWGDEAEVLIKLCDVAVVFGGKWGTLTELAHLMKINEERISANRDPVRVICLTHPSDFSVPIIETLPNVYYIFVLDLLDYDLDRLCALISS